MGVVFDKLLGESLMHSHKASDLNIEYISGATYKSLQDWVNTTQSAGKLTGGDISDNGDGTATVSAGTGFIKTSNSDTATTKFFDWSENSSLSLTNNDTNYIYVEYNSGSPQVTSSTSIPSDKNTNVVLGLAYRDGTDLHIITAGQVVANYAKKTLWKDLEINGKFQRVSGLIISEKSSRKFATTSGYIYAGLTKLPISAFDSSGADTFTYMYRDGSGGYTKVTSQSQIDNTHYDDGSGTLATLSNSWGWRSYYGVHWVYMDADEHLFVLYGRGDYLLSEAEDAQPPSDIPDLLSDIGGLIGKIIIEKDATSFTLIQSAFDVTFTPSAASEHNLLAGLQGGTSDEYYHLTSTQHTNLTGAIATTIRVTTTYTVLSTDDIVYCDTDGGAFTVTLPAGVEGKHYKLINCGSSGNNLTIDGNGSETVSGSVTKTLTDGQVADLHYNSTEGWW